jgi:hypothetical protein
MIYTFGDGFTAGHIWPEWPQFLEILVEQKIKNYGHIGAGNEYIFNCAVKSALTATPEDIFIVQWADPIRFDKIIEDDEWKNLQKTDKVYADINSTVFNQLWWSTSASTLPEIFNYNQFYVQPQQATNRSILYMISLSKMLDSLGIEHLYFSTGTKLNDYCEYNYQSELEKLPWIDSDTCSMTSFGAQFLDHGDQMQPSPIIHYRYVVEKILPRLKISLVASLEDLIKKYDFLAYDPDRDHIWEEFKHEADLLFK